MNNELISQEDRELEAWIDAKAQEAEEQNEYRNFCAFGEAY